MRKFIKVVPDGYRLLNDDEFIQKGDLCYFRPCDPGKDWVEVTNTSCFGKRVADVMQQLPNYEVLKFATKEEFRYNFWKSPLVNLASIDGSMV